MLTTSDVSVREVSANLTSVLLAILDQKKIRESRISDLKKNRLYVETHINSHEYLICFRRIEAEDGGRHHWIYAEGEKFSMIYEKVPIDLGGRIPSSLETHLDKLFMIEKERYGLTN